jgi:hypothetical protein
MSKKEISYRELLSKVSAELKSQAEAAGEKFDVKKVGKATGERWAKIKSGLDAEFIQGESKPMPKKEKASKKAKKHSEDEEENYVDGDDTAAAVLRALDECKAKIKAIMSKSNKQTKRKEKGKKRGTRKV